MQSNSAADKKKTVLSVLAWLDACVYPATVVEIAKFSSLFGQPVTIPGVEDVLRESGLVRNQNGHYCLKEADYDVHTRQRRLRESAGKIRRAKRVAKLFGLVPSVKMVALCNSLAVSNAHPDSDIDVFVVCSPGTLWSTRFLLALPLKILKLRPTPENQKDKICLSFLVSETALNLSGVQYGSDDPYMRFWVKTAVPLYDSGGVYQKFISANSWIEAGESPTGPQNETQRPINPLLRRIESVLKKIQMSRFPEIISGMANKDSRVVITDDMLKFHVKDRRALYRDRFRRRLESIST